MFDLQHKKIWIAGETGMVGRAVLQALEEYDVEIISAPHGMLDLTNQTDTYQWLEANQPDVVVMAAGKVGGIGANANNKAQFLYENLAMAQNVIHGAYLSGVQKLLYLGSSCIYPKNTKQPITEDALLTGALEPTNEGYALAKIAGIKLCQYYRENYGCNFISAMPCNLYGPHDHFDKENSHVIPALMMKMHEAKCEGQESVTLWGTGNPLREFLYVDDLARGLICVLKNYDDAMPINIGSGMEVSIKELAVTIADVVGFESGIVFDEAKPDGVSRKILDNSKINTLGWEAHTDLKVGLSSAYQWFLDNKA